MTARRRQNASEWTWASGSTVSPNLVYHNTDSEIIRAKNHILYVARRIGVAFG